LFCKPTDDIATSLEVSI